MIFSTTFVGTTSGVSRTYKFYKPVRISEMRMTGTGACTWSMLLRGGQMRSLVKSWNGPGDYGVGSLSTQGLIFAPGINTFKFRGLLVSPSDEIIFFPSNSVAATWNLAIYFDYFDSID
jgi:hypothetical protein